MSCVLFVKMDQVYSSFCQSGKVGTMSRCAILTDLYPKFNSLRLLSDICSY